MDAAADPAATPPEVKPNKGKPTGSKMAPPNPNTAPPIILPLNQIFDRIKNS